MSRLTHSLALSVRLTALVGLTTAGCSTLFPGDSTSTSGPTTATGCSAATTKHVAPGGYYVSGNSVCTASGAVHLFHGVDRPSLEWSPTGQQLSAADFQLMATWKANVVRIALNQDFWIAESPLANADYPATVDAAVKWAEEAGMDVILDLHWSDAGTLGSCKSNCQQLMADTNSIGFWADVASRYKDDGRVLFELYNEPHDVPWNVWKSGGKTSGGWTAAGMQQLYDAVRGAGAENLVVIGGLNYAFDLIGRAVESNQRLQHPLRQPSVRWHLRQGPLRLGGRLGLPDEDRSGHPHRVRGRVPDRLQRWQLLSGYQRVRLRPHFLRGSARRQLDRLGLVQRRL